MTDERNTFADSLRQLADILAQRGGIEISEDGEGEVQVSVHTFEQEVRFSTEESKEAGSANELTYERLDAARADAQCQHDTAGHVSDAAEALNADKYELLCKTYRLERENTELQEEVTHLAGENETLRKELWTLKHDLDLAEAAQQEAETSLSALSGTHSTVVSRRDLAEERLRKAMLECDALREARDEGREVLKKLVHQIDVYFNRTSDTAEVQCKNARSELLEIRQKLNEMTTK